GALTIQAQNVASDADVTSGGEQAADYGTGNAFYGYKAGSQSTPRLPEGRDYNTFIGNLAGSRTKGSENVFIGYNSGLKSQQSLVSVVGTGNVFIGTNTGLTIPQFVLDP